MRTHAEIEKTEGTQTAYVSAMFYCYKRQLRTYEYVCILYTL